MKPTNSTSEKHDKDCHLGDNWKRCKCCVEQWNDTAAPKDIMKIPGEVKSDDKLWLARAIDDHTVGNSTIDMDWGRFSIVCQGGGAGHTGLKNLLVELAQDYLRLRKKYDTDQ